MSLLTRLQVSRVAFHWSGTTRVYEVSRILVTGEEDVDTFTLESGQKRSVTGGVWLYFQIESESFRRVSPSGFPGNDQIDILNALQDSSLTVDFFPIWDVDESVSYSVQRVPGRHDLLQTSRTLFKPAINLSLESIEIQSEWPLWARTTRQRG